MKFPARASFLPALIFLRILLGQSASSAAEPVLSKSVVWQIDNATSIGGFAVTMLGAPAVVEIGKGRVVCFNGANDGLVLPANPIAGWPAFTIQARIKPDASGATEQRFFHIQDSRGTARALLEIRLNRSGEWWLDAFLSSEAGRLALIDPAKKHPAGNWHWVAMSYDGRTMANFMDGVREKEGAVEFPPMLPGECSIGVRLNRVSWFKGCIEEIRFDPVVLSAEALQR